METQTAKATGQKRTWKRRLARMLFVPAGTYLGVVIVFMALENWFVYHPKAAEGDWWIPPPSPEIQDVQLTVEDGTPIHAWWWPAPALAKEDQSPKRKRGEPGQAVDSPGAILYCHGNAGNLSSRGPTLAKLRQIMGEAILIFDYPGYGKSGGSVSESGCYQAADAAYDWLVQVQQIAPERILIYGGSLGGGVAVDLASRKKHRALVLAKTFTSLPDVAHHLYPWLPVRWLMRNRFDNLSKIGQCRQPLYMVHGTADQLIPIPLAKRLFAAANEPKRFYQVDGGDHNDYLPVEFFQDLRAFLGETAHPRPNRPEPAAN